MRVTKAPKSIQSSVLVRFWCDYGYSVVFIGRPCRRSLRACVTCGTWTGRLLIFSFIDHVFKFPLLMIHIS